MLSQAFFIPKIYKFLFLGYILLEGRRMDFKKTIYPFKVHIFNIKICIFCEVKKRGNKK